MGSFFEESSNKLTNQSHKFLWKRYLYFISATQLVTIISTNSFLSLLPLYIREILVDGKQHQEIWTGYIYAGPFFLAMIITPFWGVLSNKFGIKKVVTICLSGLTAILFLMGFAQNIWHLFFLRILQGGTFGFLSVTFTYVNSITPEEKNGQALSFLQSASSIGSIIAPILGGFIADSFGVRVIFYTMPFFSLVGAIISLRFIKADIEKKNGDSPLRDFEKNINLAWKKLSARRLLLRMFIAQIAFGVTVPAMLPYLEILQTPPQMLASLMGTILSCSSILSIISLPFWGRYTDCNPYHLILLYSSAIIGITTVIQSLIPNYLYLFPLQAIIGIFSSGLIPVMFIALGKIAAKEQCDSLLSFGCSATMIGNLLSPLLSSYILSVLGIKWCFIISGILFLLISLSFILETKYFRFGLSLKTIFAN